MKRALLLVLALGLAASLAAGVLPFRPGFAPPGGSLLDSLPGSPIGSEEAESIRGGDVFISLDGPRNRLTVKVYPNDDELRRLKPVPIKTLEVDAHNRIVDTTKAPYMPAAASKLPAGANLTSRPSPFPSGTCSITGVKPTSGKYGPNMISTDAVGKVEVFADGKSLGSYSDAGYAIHSNSNDFRASKSFGCIIVREADNAAIAKVLREDRADAERSKQSRRPVQLLHVGD